jgi:prepilin-type N-terminal cleavage/methylation domain-containing protein
MTRRARREGFTLLEVLLASVIAVLLLAALYVALDVTVGQTDASREAVASNNLSRAVINRMSTDLSQSLGPMPPKSGGGSNPSSAQGSTQQTTQQTGQQATQQTGQQATQQSAQQTSQASQSTTPTDPAVQDAAAADGTFVAADVPFQAGVMGTDKTLTVFVSRVPLTLTDAAAASNTEVQQPADLRRVTYYLASDGSGLCRQERPWVTADGVRNSVEPDRSDEAADLIAPEVKDVSFEYLDAGFWLGEWDGSLPGTDGVTVTGPPRAVRATFTLEVPVRGGGVVEKKVQHVFLVRSAVGTYVPPTEGATEDPAMDPAATGGTTP